MSVEGTLKSSSATLATDGDYPVLLAEMMAIKEAKRKAIHMWTPNIILEIDS